MQEKNGPHGSKKGTDVFLEIFCGVGKGKKAKRISKAQADDQFKMAGRQSSVL